MVVRRKQKKMKKKNSQSRLSLCLHTKMDKDKRRGAEPTKDRRELPSGAELGACAKSSRSLLYGETLIFMAAEKAARSSKQKLHRSENNPSQKSFRFVDVI
jgi:hypothetical protein